MAQDDGVIRNLGKTMGTLPSMMRVLEILMIVMALLLMVITIYTVLNQGSVNARIEMSGVEVSLDPIQTDVTIHLPFIDRILDALGL